MGLPAVNITLDNGAIGGTPASDDGIAGLILTGATYRAQTKSPQAMLTASLV